MAVVIITIIVFKVSMVLEDSSSVLPMLGFKSSKVIKLMVRCYQQYAYKYFASISSIYTALVQIAKCGHLIPFCRFHGPHHIESQVVASNSNFGVYGASSSDE